MHDGIGATTVEEEQMELGLTGRTAFVAAASAGIGRGVALAFAAEGADVGLCARDGSALETVAMQVRAAGVRAVPVVADVTDARAVRDAVQRTIDATGRLDALVVNAGGPPPGRFTDLDDDSWQTAYRLTLMSAVHLVREALPALRRSDAASILFLASWSVKQPIGGLLLSNSVRSAVNGLAKTLAGELAPDIRVNSILTGRIRTGRTEELTRHHHPDAELETMLAQEARAIPLQRFGTVEELARVAVFLSSPAASYVTGVALPVDGGVIEAPM
ncbi:MAG TPA: SDR family oxidoreductase [Candidatus Deferrimicrobium sp.]|nr:SDR family oxidoreductase [Candidatus Deferrimicrobium sp.]